LYRVNGVLEICSTHVSILHRLFANIITLSPYVTACDLEESYFVKTFETIAHV